MMTSANAPVNAAQNPLLTKTHISTVRAHLMTGATITTWDAYRLYQITCLAQRIHDLRNSGLVIQSEIVRHNDKRFSLYWLDEATLLEVEHTDNAASEVTL